MPKSLVLLALLLLEACSGMPTYQRAASPCDASEASMECQVERYNNVNVQ
jgi:hypothetical protein